MESREKSTEWALLFPLKAGLFAMKSSLSSKSVCRESRESRETRESKERLSMKHLQPRARMRRGSSLSDLDKLQNKTMLPDVVKSTEKCSESLPHSPALSRTNLQLGGSCNVRGSIGDLMNMKKYGGSSWSVRSETLIARAVPLSTVTAKQHSLSFEKSAEEFEELELRNEFPISGKPLTCAQRTQRLSKLIKKQRRMVTLSPDALQKSGVSRCRRRKERGECEMQLFSISLINGKIWRVYTYLYTYLCIAKKKKEKQGATSLN